MWYFKTRHDPCNGWHGSCRARCRGCVVGMTSRGKCRSQSRSWIDYWQEQYSWSRELGLATERWPELCRAHYTARVVTMTKVRFILQGARLWAFSWHARCGDRDTTDVVTTYGPNMTNVMPTTLSMSWLRSIYPRHTLCDGHNTTCVTPTTYAMSWLRFRDSTYVMPTTRTSWLICKSCIVQPRPHIC